MEQSNTPFENSNSAGFGPARSGTEAAPNSSGALVLGILSIILFGLLGLILGIIAVSIAGSGKRAYNSNPSRYTLKSYKNLKAGSVCGIIGICLSSVGVILLVLVLIANA